MHLSPFEGAAERLDDSGIQEFQSKESPLMRFAFTFEMMLNFRPSNLQDICKNLARKNHMKVANRVVATGITRENSWVGSEEIRLLAALAAQLGEEPWLAC